MISNNNISISDFSPHLFWDVDRSKMLLGDCRDFLVERVLLRGNRKDLRLVEMAYTREQINSVIRKISWMSEVDMAFVEVYFKIPKEELKCYTQKALVHYC